MIIYGEKVPKIIICGSLVRTPYIHMNEFKVSTDRLTEKRSLDCLAIGQIVQGKDKWETKDTKIDEIFFILLKGYGLVYSDRCHLLHWKKKN